MESTAFIADVRPWRTAAVVASAVAAVELLVLLVIGVALLAKPVAEHVKKAAVAQALAPPVHKPKVVPLGAPKLDRSETAVLILNGNGRTGAASTAAERVRAKGYQVASVGDAPRRDYARSLIMFRPASHPRRTGSRRISTSGSSARSTGCDRRRCRARTRCSCSACVSRSPRC